MKLNTIFLGIIAAVAVGAAVVWWMGQPSAAERRSQALRESIDNMHEAVDRYQAAAGALRAASGN